MQQSYKADYMYQLRYYQALILFNKKSFSDVKEQTSLIINNIKQTIDNDVDNTSINYLQTVERLVSNLQRDSFRESWTVPKSEAQTMTYKDNEKVKLLNVKTGNITIKKYRVAKDKIAKGSHKLIN